MRSKLMTIAENVPKVYKAGQSSMVDESKTTPKTVSGTSVSLSDVSKLPHSVSCKVSSLNLFQPTRNSVSSPTGITLTRRDDDSYRVFGTATSLYRVSLGEYHSESASAFYISGGTQDMPLRVDLLKGNILKSTATNSGGVLVIPNESYVFDGVDICVAVGTGETVDAIVKPMVSLYDHSTYTPYRSSFEGVQVIKYGADESEGYQILTSNAEGIVEGMTSTSPQMNILSDTEGVVFEVTYHKSWGMQFEYDRVWDDYQDNGTKTNYHTAFASRGWISGTTYNPKYPIVCSGNNTASNMFASSYVTDTIVPITISGANASVFYGSKIKTIHKLILGSGITSMSDWFNNMADLEDITIEGEIPVSTKFTQSTKLNAKSLVSIVEALSASASGKTLTLSQTAVNNADWTTTEYNSWDALVAIKPSGWTITLA